MNDFRQEYLNNLVEMVMSKFMGALEKTIDQEEAAYLWATVLAHMISGHSMAVKTMVGPEIHLDAFRKTIDSLIDIYGLKTSPKILFA